METDNWSELDNLTCDDERFKELNINDYYCDYCECKVVEFPFFDLTIPSARNSINLCHCCVDCPVEYKIRKYSKVLLFARCFLCNEDADPLPKVLRLYSSRINLYCCDRCSRSDNLSADITKKFTRVTQDFAVIKRGVPVPVNLSAPNRLLKNSLCPPRNMKTWVSMLEDIVYLPSDFGPVKQWGIISEKKYFLGYSNLIIYFLLNYSDERIGAIVSDKWCCASVFVVDHSLQNFKENEHAWNLALVKLNAKKHFSILEQLNKLILRKEYLTAIKKFTGYLVPGKCSVVDHFILRNKILNHNK